MTTQLYGRNTETGECGWFTPAPDRYLDNVAYTNNSITFTMADGTTWTVPNPDVANFEYVNGQLVLTETDGSVFTVTPPADWSLYITGVSHDGDTITVTRSDGATWIVPDINVDTFQLTPEGNLAILETDGTLHTVVPPISWNTHVDSIVRDPATSIVTVTMTDGVVHTYQDVHVDDYTIDANGNMTIHMNDGTTHTINAPAAWTNDLYVTNFTKTGDVITLTRNDGSTWSVNDTSISAFFINGAGNLQIDENDGTTYQITPPPEWSDVFVSYVGTDVNFADGDVLSLGNLNENIIQLPDGSYVLRDDANNDSGVVKKDVSRTVIADFIPSDYGVSAGQWNKPINRAATQAEVTHPNALLVSHTPYALGRIITNRAVEAGAGALGVGNPNGQLGYFSHSFGAGTDINSILDFNGAYVQRNIVDGVPFTLPQGRYPGQRLKIQWGAGASTFDEMPVNGAIAGILRRFSDHKITSVVSNAGATNVALVRGGEDWEMVFDGLRWRVNSSEMNMFSGVNWQEEDSGFTTMFGVITAIPALGIATELIPVPIVNDVYLINVTLGQFLAGFPTITSPIGYITDTVSNLSFQVGNRSNQPVSAHYHLERCVLDYANL